VDGANGVAFTSDSRLMVTGSLDRTVKLWDVASGTELDELTRHHKPVNCVAISPDDRLLATGDGVWQRPDEPGEVIVWDLRTRQPLATLRDHQGCVFGLAFSPDGRTLATGSTDRTIRLYTVTRSPAE
jgi:WD40 repeat protein